VPTNKLYIDSIRDFVDKMNTMTNKRTPYFSLNYMNFETHDKLSASKSYDQNLRDFIKHSEESGYLNNTLLIVLSDHGSSVNGEGQSSLIYLTASWFKINQVV
jgi:arylsulfatase A-like enzyme